MTLITKEDSSTTRKWSRSSYEWKCEDVTTESTHACILIMYTLRKKPKRIHYYYQESGRLQFNDVINGRIFRELECNWRRSCTLLLKNHRGQRTGTTYCCRWNRHIACDFFFAVLIRMTTSSLYRRRTLLTINETFCALCNIVQKLFVWRIALVSFSPS